MLGNSTRSTMWAKDVLLESYSVWPLLSSVLILSDLICLTLINNGSREKQINEQENQTWT